MGGERGPDERRGSEPPTVADSPLSRAPMEETADTQHLASGATGARARAHRSISELETRVDRPAASLVSPTSGRTPLTSLHVTTVTSPDDVMRVGDAVRYRLLAMLMMVMVANGLWLLWLFDAHPVSEALWAAACAIAFVCFAILWWVTYHPEHYSENLIGVLAIFVAIAEIGYIHYWGVFSAGTALTSIVLYQYSLTPSFRWTFSIFLVVAIGHAGLFVLQLTGTIPNLSLVHADGFTMAEQIATQVSIVGIYGLAYAAGRLARRRNVEAVEALDQAARAVSEREVLLNEARQELERAAWVGGAGRFTDQVLGGFRLGNVLGRGGMGEVYEAVHEETGELAAVKLLQRNVLSNPMHVERFAREARIVGSLASPNIVKVLAVGDESAPLPFIAMERLDGHDLSWYLRKSRRLPVDQTLDLVAQVARGLEAARDADVVHRDLKPQNLFGIQVGKRLTWKILDFGVSKLTGDDSQLTRDRMVGTPGYMAPEQARGHDLDHRADVYALAAIAYRCLTGRPLFTGRDAAQVVYQLVNEFPALPSTFDVVDDPRKAADLDRALVIGLAKQPAERFTTAGELSAALRAVFGGGLSGEWASLGRHLVARDYTKRE